MAEPGTRRGRYAAGLALATFVPLAVAPLLTADGGRRPDELLGVAVVVAYAGHVAATGWLWSAPDVRGTVRGRPVRLVVLPVVLVLAGVVGAVALGDRELPWLLVPFFVWQFSHIQRQNLGLVAQVSALWDGRRPCPGERRAVLAAGWIATAALLARPRLLDLPGQLMPTRVGDLVRLAAAAGLAACAVLAVALAVRHRRPVPVAVAQLGAVAFVTPAVVCTSTVAAVTGMVVAHGLQYLWAVTVRTSRSRSGPAAGPAITRRWRSALPVAVLAIVGGSVLAAMAELRTAGDGLRLLYGAYLGIVMAHFAVDSAVWRRTPVAPVPRPRRQPLVLSPAHGRT